MVMRLSVNAQGRTEKVRFAQLERFANDSTRVLSELQEAAKQELIWECERVLRSARFEPSNAPTEEEIKVSFIIR